MLHTSTMRIVKNFLLEAHVCLVFVSSTMSVAPKPASTQFFARRINTLDNT